MRRGIVVVLGCVLAASVKAEIPITVVGQLGGQCKAVYVAPDGTLAYAGVGTRVVVLDLSDPNGVRELGKSPVLPEVVEHVVVSGDYAFVADGIAGLYVLDVSDPAAPAVVGHYEIPIEARWLRRFRGFRVCVSGKHAYFCNGDGGLHILDVSNPAEPTCVTVLEDVHARDVEVVDGYAYVASTNQGLLVLDASDPAHPTPAGRFDASCYFLEVEVADGCAYATGQGKAPPYPWGLFVVDVRDPLKPVLAGRADLKNPAGLAVSGKIAYVGNGWSGVDFIRITNPAVPSRIGGYKTSGFPVSVTAKAGRVYVAASHSGLEVVDVSNPALPVAGKTYTTREFGDVTVSGDYAYTVSAYKGLQVIDIRDPNNPTWRSELYFHGASCISMGKDCVWLNDGVRVMAVDVSNPLAPEMAGWRSVGNNIMSITVDGTRIYATAGKGLTIVDGSNPAKPAILGRCELSDITWGVCASGKYAYVTGLGGLDILDISNPAAPVRMGNYIEPGDWLFDGVIKGDHAYVANGRFGLRVIDVSDPWLPGRVRQFDTHHARSIVIQGDYGYLTDFTLGLHIFDVSSPATLVQLGGCESAGFNTIAVSDEYVYAADWSGGLVVLKVGPPGDAVLDE